VILCGDATFVLTTESTESHRGYFPARLEEKGIISTTNSSTRRSFLSAASAVVALPTIVAPSALGRGTTAPNDKITVGVVGLGARAFSLIDSLLGQKVAQITVVCDVDEFHYRDRKWGTGTAYGRRAAKEKILKRTKTAPAVTDDFREVCQRDDLDAVIVATPDHWHALCTLEALRHGKDVYCEKPVTHTFHEGQQVYREVAKQNRIFQTGSQQRSDRLFRRAVELVRNGHLGDLQRVEVGLPPGYDKPQGDATVILPPEHLDYDLWCGPAPKLPYMRARHHRWWRGHRAFGGGVLMDWIGHHNDIAHWAMDVDDSGPVRVEAVNWEFPRTDVYDTPRKYEIACEYKGGVKSSISSQHPMGTRLIGTDGWVHVTRGRIRASVPEWAQSGFSPGSVRVYESSDHMANFLAGVRSRRACIAPAETAHRSITPGHLGYVSHALGRAIRWNPGQEIVEDDAEANELLQKNQYRAPWG